MMSAASADGSYLIPPPARRFMPVLPFFIVTQHPASGPADENGEKRAWHNCEEYRDTLTLAARFKLEKSPDPENTLNSTEEAAASFSFLDVGLPKLSCLFRKLFVCHVVSHINGLSPLGRRVPPVELILFLHIGQTAPERRPIHHDGLLEPLPNRLPWPHRRQRHPRRGYLVTLFHYHPTDTYSGLWRRNIRPHHLTPLPHQPSPQRRGLFLCQPQHPPSHPTSYRRTRQPIPPPATSSRAPRALPSEYPTIPELLSSGRMPTRRPQYFDALQ